MENKPKFKPNPKLRLMDQVRQVLNQMKGTHLLMAKVMYGEGYPGGKVSPGNPIIISHTKVQISLSSTMAEKHFQRRRSLVA